jgi:hypothetical protein
MIKSFECINISAKDTIKLTKFPIVILGIPILFEGYGNYDGVKLGFIQGAPTICIWDENKWGAYEGKPTFVFKCDDLDKTYEELKQKGLDLNPPYTASWGGREMQFKDLEGCTIMLLEM